MILEDFGPVQHTMLSIPSLFLVSAWPVVIGSVSLVYGGTYLAYLRLPSVLQLIILSTVRSIYHFYRHQSHLSEMISSRNGHNRSLYIRLMMFSGVEILLTIPLGSFFMAVDIKQGLSRWVSWADVHSSYSVIDQVPSIVWKHDLYQALGFEMFRWLLVLCAFIFFAFFGFAEEARKNYRRVYRWFASLFGYSTSSGTSIGSSDA